MLDPEQESPPQHHTPQQQDTFTYEYTSEPETTDSADYLNNVWSNNWNHFDGEVPVDGPSVEQLLLARPQIPALMADLAAAEHQFWLGHYAAGNNNGRSERNNFYRTLAGGPSLDFFKSCSQGCSVNVYAGGTGCGSKAGTPGRFHSCPNLHVHGDNFVATPPVADAANDHQSADGGNEEENRTESRINTLKGLPQSSARKQKATPACKICDTFSINAPPAVADCPDSIYEAYKRNCTYKAVFEKQEVADCRHKLDPAEPIRTLFDEKSTPSLDEIGRALLSETGGLVSSTTPANWVQELIELLNPTPSKPHPSYPSSKAPVANTTILSLHQAKRTNPKSKPRRRFTFPKLKPNPKASASVNINMGVLPLPKLLRGSLSKKLLHVKSRYLDHFEKAAAAAAAAKLKEFENQGQGAESVGVGDGSQIVAALSSSKTQITVGGDNLAKRSPSATQKPAPTPVPIRKPAPLPFSFVRLAQVRAAQQKSNLSPILPTKATKSRFGPPKKVNLESKGKGKIKIIRKKHRNHKSKKMSPKISQSKLLSKSFTKLKVVHHGCGFAFDDHAADASNKLPYQSLTPSRSTRKMTSACASLRVKRSRKSIKKATLSKASASNAKKRIRKVEHDLEKYKQTILKMLESGSLMGTSLDSTSGEVSPSPKAKPLALPRKEKPSPVPIPVPRVRVRNPYTSTSQYLKKIDRPVPAPVSIRQLHLQFDPTTSKQRTNPLVEAPYAPLMVYPPKQSFQSSISPTIPRTPTAAAGGDATLAESSSLQSIISTRKLFHRHSDPGSPHYLGLYGNYLSRSRFDQ